MPRLSAIIITRNEARNIGDCLEALAFCDERIVVDGGSDDGTPEIARAKGARVTAAAWHGFGAQKNFALSLAGGDWVLSIDADERVTPSLAQAIGILIVALGVYLCYRYADQILQKLGPTGTSVVVRLSAFILLCIGVQICWNGVHGLIASGFHLA